MPDNLANNLRRRLYGLPVFKHSNALEVHIKPGDPAEISRLFYWAENKPFLRIFLPVDIITMEGALHYSSQCNPFVAMLDSGAEILSSHYRKYQPKNLAEMYRLEIRGLAGEQLPVNTLPWILSHHGKEDQGEMGLGPEHGVSYFGPVSDEKLKLEIERLKTTLDSIASKGYLPNRHGDISGYFMRRGDDFRFKVRGGKHRAAALVHLKENNIPVRMKPGWPRVIDRNYSSEWPLVASGDIDVKLAEDIFDRFFDRQSLKDIQIR